MTSTSGKVTAGRKGFSAEIRIEGLEDTIAALRALEPDVLKRLNRTLRTAANKVASEAAGAGVSGHKMSYRVTNRQRGKKAGMSIIAADRDTAIFEFAGSLMRSRDGGPITPQGAGMVRWLDEFGKPGRFLWAAWDSQKVRFEADVSSAMAEAERELQAHLNAAGEGF